MAAHDQGDSAKSKSKRVMEIKRKSHKTPIALYSIDEKLSALVRNPGFLDAILIVLAFFGAATALPFYPLIVGIAIAIVLFAVTVKKEFLGLILFVVAITPLIMYQLPGLAWLFMVVVAASLVYGYKHYRTILFTYLIISVAFSPIGYIAAIPIFIISVLVIGFKRATLMAVVFVLAVVALSAVSGIQNSAYIVYNAKYAYSQVNNTAIIAYTTPNTSARFSLFNNFKAGLSESVSRFTNGNVLNDITPIMGAIAQSYTINTLGYAAELVVLIAIAFVIDEIAVISRKRYSGTKASFVGLGYPAIASILSLISHQSIRYEIAFTSFVLAPLILYFLEFFNVKIVKALDIRKQDLRMKFGDAFEDLESGNVKETFDDIGNYDSVKKELKNAVLAPIEEKGISKAYNVHPSKGILFFGPPGTGKTLMMRALANEIHAGFYYVKASNLISSFPGETERMVTNIFTIAKKHAPCVLFFDEIDSIAASRDNPSISETSRQALSQLLVEMDGFQSYKNVIIVGATNAPNLLDKAILRPGRFDRIIYMPPPDYDARKKIFELYLKKLPVSNEIDTDEIAEMTERLTGADIKALCEGVAQNVAQEATAEHKVLEITHQAIMDRIESTKPSISLAQLDMYQKFRLDFERSTYGEHGEEMLQEITMKDVVGLDEAKKAIHEAIEIPLLHRDLVKKYAIKNMNGILLFGPPGVGKTMLMKAVKSEMKEVTMIELTGSEISDQGIEKATATIRQVFDRARENAPSIILIEEADELLLKRTGASEFSAQITAEILKEIDSVTKMENVVVVGTTNRPEVIDSAALRPGRFDKLIFVKPPSKEQRAMMFRGYLKEVPIAAGIDYSYLGDQTPGFTGADIENVCREAKTEALESTVKTGREAKITQDMLEKMIKKVRPSAPDNVVSQYAQFLAKYGER